MIKYKIKDIAYTADEETGDTLVTQEGQIVLIRTKNPIEGFNTFWQSAGSKVLNEIKDKIESHGFNRWTGEKEQ